jgi:hypothetical protein
MNDNLRRLVQKYRKRGLLIDTNLLLLYIIGSFNIELIREFRRTSHFTIDDFYLISDFIELFESKITTPHILTEVSNLIGNKPNLKALLKIYISNSDEKSQESIKVVQNDAFIKFGITDAAIIEVSKNSHLVMTDDNPFYGLLVNKGMDTVNLDELRLEQ